MIHYTTPEYWDLYNKLPVNVQRVADKNFELLKYNLYHPSLHFKQIKTLYSVRAGLHYRALGTPTPDKDGIIWFWIGNHSNYDELLKE